MKSIKKTIFSACYSDPIIHTVPLYISIKFAQKKYIEFRMEDTGIPPIVDRLIINVF